jgi:membrane protein YqaA with SNARE-associated domain
LRVLLAAAGVLTAMTTAGAAFAPALLTHAPLLLVALSPLYRHLVLVATRVDFLPFVLVALPARLLGSLVGYGIGAGHGEQSLAWLQSRAPRMGRLLRVLEGWFRVASVPLLLFWPGPLFCALAGAAGMQPGRFAFLAVIAQALQVAIAYRLAELIEPWLVPIVAFFREHTVSATLVCVFAVVLYRWWRRPRAVPAVVLSESAEERR